MTPEQAMQIDFETVIVFLSHSKRMREYQYRADVIEKELNK